MEQHSFRRLVLRTVLLVSAVLASAGTVADVQRAAAGGSSAEVPVLTVAAPADPVEKSYRRMILGMDLFERRSALAPSATLRFKLLPRRMDTDPSLVDVEILGETVSLRVPVAPDSTFTLQRIPKAWDEDASVQANRKTLTLTWRAEIRTPASGFSRAKRAAMLLSTGISAAAHSIFAEPAGASVRFLTR